MVLEPSEIYTLLFHTFGPQKWWPVDNNYHKKKRSDSRVEVIVGAILTQNTAWANVEKALTNLKKKNLLTLKKIATINTENLKSMIQPSGYFNQKSIRLKNIAKHLHTEYKDNLDSFFNKETNKIRQELLSLDGIGPETADSILIYAGNHPVFVVDAYTKRICKRIPVNVKSDAYEEIQQYFEDELKKKFFKEKTTTIFKEMHAIIVLLAKIYCKKKPECKTCPLNKYCEYDFIKKEENKIY
jgi:endonuclease-3 related protein